MVDSISVNQSCWEGKFDKYAQSQSGDDPQLASKLPGENFHETQPAGSGVLARREAVPVVLHLKTDLVAA